MLLVVEYFDDPVQFGDASDVMKGITVPSSERNSVNLNVSSRHLVGENPGSTQPTWDHRTRGGFQTPRKSEGWSWKKIGCGRL